MLLTLTLLATSAVAVSVDYSSDLEAVLNGTFMPNDNAAGPAWFNLTDTLPGYLDPAGLQSYGVHSYTSQDRLVDIANMALQASDTGNWGDYLYLYNAFSYGGAVTNTLLRNGTQIFADLASMVFAIGEDQIDSLISTSSSSTLADIYSDMNLSENPNLNAVELVKRNSWTGIHCSTSHVPDYYDCQDLVETTLHEVNIIRGGPRNLNYYSCYISWSQNANFEEGDLYNAAYATNQDCVIDQKSGYITGVDLGSYDGIEQCLSNRATGCG